MTLAGPKIAQKSSTGAASPRRAPVINTLPDKTLAALVDHGKPALRIEAGVAEAETQLAQLARLGIDMDTVGNTLQDDGVKLFESAIQKLLQQTG